MLIGIRYWCQGINAFRIQCCPFDVSTACAKIVLKENAHRQKWIMWERKNIEWYTWLDISGTLFYNARHQWSIVLRCPSSVENQLVMCVISGALIYDVMWRLKKFRWMSCPVMDKSHWIFQRGTHILSALSWHAFDSLKCIVSKASCAVWCVYAS